MNIYKGKIARIFIIKILLFSMVITTLMTVIQLYNDYIAGIEDIYKNSDLIQYTHLNSITKSIWNYDIDSLEVQIDGLMKLSDIQYLEILTNDNKLFQRGEKLGSEFIVNTYILEYQHNNKTMDLGSLTVQFSLKGLYRKLWDKVIIILVSQGIKTFLVSFFIFYLFYNLVGRYLSVITNFAKHLNDVTLSNELILDKPINKDSDLDEIDILVTSLNDMRVKFIQKNNQKDKTTNALNYQATHDALTNLPNRTLLYDRASHLINKAERESKKIAFLFLDLDEFKQVNDVHGHSVGDSVLIHISNVLKSNIRKSDTVARLSGDEFVALVYVGKKMSVISHLATKIIDALNEPFKVNGISIKVTVSIGVSVYPDDANTPELLLRNADTAMFKSKQMGRNMLQFYLPEFTKKAELRTQLENELDLAIKNDEILIYYQPQIDQNGCLIGVESLARWNHPVKGFIPPNIFIPISEESGQIIPLSNLIFDKVFSFLSTLEKKDLPETFKTMSINVSPKHFNQKGFCTGVNESLKHYGVDASKVMIEITESLILTNVNEVINKMERLKSMAIKFSIDDFGTGYSSLSYLQQLPLDEIKIDQSFIREMLDDKGSAVIVEMIITMADKLGFTLMAEGVETIQHKEFLISLGCFNYQGYYFDRPMSEEKFLEKYI